MEKLYKATDGDSTCRGYQYIPGELYVMEPGSIEICSRGFHACRELRNVLQYYPFPKEIWEVEGNVVSEQGNKVVCDQIRLVRLITDEALTALAEDEEWRVRRIAARNINTPPETLTMLAEDEDIDVRWAVVENIKTPSEALTILAGDEDEDVRNAVAENTNTPPEVLVILAGDKEWTVRSAVAWNINTPLEILIILTKDGDWTVRSAAAETLKDKKD